MSRRLFMIVTAAVVVSVGAWFLLKPVPKQKAEGAAPALRLLYNAEEHPGEKSLLSQVIQAQLKKAGIDVRLDPEPSTIYSERTSKGEFDGNLSLWYLDYDDPEGFLTDFYSKAGFRLSKYDNPAYDQAYLAALFARTREEQLAKYRAAAEVLDNDLPWIPLFSNDELFLIKKAASGFRSNSFQYYDYRRISLPEVRVATDVEVQTLDPALTYDLASKHLVTQSYEGLIAMDEHNSIIPGLATDWSFSPGGDALTFNLRAGVKFHPASFLADQKQRTVNASDVKASFERLIRANSPYSYIFDHVQGVEAFKDGKAARVEGFVVEGPLKFTIKLQKPLLTMLPWLLAPAAYILPEDLPKQYDFASGSCGTGPFILASWDGSEAKFKANSDYWMKEGGATLPLSKSLSVSVVKDANIQLEAYKQGRIDILNIPLPLYDLVLDPQGNVRSNWSDSIYRAVQLYNLQFIAFNMKSGPWASSVELRRRVEKAIDRTEIVQKLFNGKARVARSIIPQGVAGFKPK